MTAAAFSSKWKQQHSAAGASSTIQQQVAAATGGGSIHSSRSNMHSSRWGQRWGHVPARTFYTVAGPSFWPKYPLICSQTSQTQDRPWEQALLCRDPTSNKAGSGVRGPPAFVFMQKRSGGTDAFTSANSVRRQGVVIKVSTRRRPLLQPNVSPKARSGTALGRDLTL